MFRIFGYFLYFCIFSKFGPLQKYFIAEFYSMLFTCEHSDASSWKVPRTKSQYSFVVILHCPCMPIQQGWPITSQTICSAILSFAPPGFFEANIGLFAFLRHIGHFVISSGHSYGWTLAGASQNLKSTKSFRIVSARNVLWDIYFGSNPQTDPDILPPGPESPADHFFHVEMVFCR